MSSLISWMKAETKGQRLNLVSWSICTTFLLLMNTNIYCLAFHQECKINTNPYLISRHPKSFISNDFSAISSFSSHKKQSPNDKRSRHLPQYTHKQGLFSLNHLIQDIENYESSNDPRVVFVGGKGGVGKTTISSSIAVTLASSMNNLGDQKILIVSTDPAHSLGDALDCDLRSMSGKVMPMTDPMTAGKLYACEVDPTEALEEFQNNLSTFDVEKLADALGVPSSLLESLGLREFSTLLNNPPPGLDELVALANVLKNDDTNDEFDVIIVDTAPTGHTLRLLQLPQFLDGLLGKLLQLRMKLSGLASTLQAFFGSEEAAQRTQTLDNAVANLESFRVKMSNMRSRLQDSSKTNFVVVTVPTKLGVAESKRLMTELNSQNVLVTDIVVNQCVGSENDSEALKNYYDRRKSGQSRWIKKLQESMNDVSQSDEYKSNGSNAPIALTKVPFSDIELVGVPALAYLAKASYSDNLSFSHLMEENANEDPKFVICGGKGGVGKTTSSSALAVAMAGTGHNVALISTDPAHSLGDALDMNIAGGNLIDCPLIGMPPTSGSLSVMEVDPSAALGQFKTLIDDLIGSSDDSDPNGMRSTLSGLGEIFDTLPPGTDEVVALAKVVNLLKQGGYDRIVLDTAPTGHTLRMLSTPGFLAELIDRVLDISQKINSNSMVKMLINSGGKAETVDATVEAATSALLSFQMQMYDLEDLFANAEQTEFMIVTVPTELAVRESVRLLNDLTFEAPDMPIKVKNIVVNQVLEDDGNDVEIFLKRVESGQKTCIDDLKRSADKTEVTLVPYLDTEPRGVFGLKALSYELLNDE